MRFLLEMPFKSSKIPLSQEQDRRVKLTTEQKDIIRQEYKTGMYSLNSLARKYNVSKKTILLIVNPSSKAKNDERIKNHWRDYYNTEEHSKAIKDTRRYKQDLYLKGELKENGESEMRFVLENKESFKKDSSEKMLDEALGLTDALAQAETEEEKAEIEQQIDVIDTKIDYADDHGLAKDHLIDEMDALNEEIEEIEDVVEPGEIIDDPFLPDEYERDDDISDFGPGNPWDAPGMSVKDFLR